MSSSGSSNDCKYSIYVELLWWSNSRLVKQCALVKEGSFFLIRKQEQHMQGDSMGSKNVIINNVPECERKWRY